MQVLRETGDQVIVEVKTGELPKVRNFRDLLVWQQAIELVEQVYVLTAKFPKEEMYGLTSQLRRAAISVPSNIAEGHTRDSLKEYLQFLSIALASLAEVQTQLYLSKRLNLATPDSIAPIEDLADKTLKMLRNLQRSLKEKL
jgi:four helix bundle protein